MKEKLEQYFKTDFHYFEEGLKNEDDIRHRNDMCWYARQRALGAIDMAQLCGLDFATCEKMFDEYCKKLEEKVHGKMC